MPRSSKDRVEFHLEAESARSPRVIEEDEPFRIALAGDFGGRRQRVRHPILIDRDNFEEVLESLDVQIDLPGGRLHVTSLDHFHPDHLYATHPAFHEMRETRARLNDPATSAQAARELAGEQHVRQPIPMPPTSGSLLDLIAGAGGTAAQPAQPTGDLQEFIDRAMRPYLEPRPDSRASELIGQVDEIAADLLRAMLHQARFKTIEAAWRMLYRLVRRLETGTDLKLYLIDISKEELAENPEEFYQTLLRQPDPWAVIAGNYAFPSSELGLLQVMGKIAARLEVPFLAEADASLVGADPKWSAFRQTAEAKHVGLALPRIQLRLPYGAETDPCEVPGFEEISGKPDARHMLYGNPGYFLAALLGETFQSYGWQMRPGAVRDISNLPVYTYEEDGEKKAFPCGEIELTQDTAEALMDEGFIPLAAIRDTDVVRVLRFQSAAEPVTALSGRWN